jgi:hypothetical protein
VKEVSFAPIATMKLHDSCQKNTDLPYLKDAHGFVHRSLDMGMMHAL